MAANSQLAQDSEAGILARLIQTKQEALSLDAAKYPLSLNFDERDISRAQRIGEIRLAFPGRGG
jgi:hypothetical protein